MTDGDDISMTTTSTWLAESTTTGADGLSTADTSTDDTSTGDTTDAYSSTIAEIIGSTTEDSEQQDRGMFVLILVACIAAVLILALGLACCWFYWGRRAKNRAKGIKQTPLKNELIKRSTSRQPTSSTKPKKKSKAGSKAGSTASVKMVDERKDSVSGENDELQSETMDESSTSTVTSSSTQLSEDSALDQDLSRPSQGSSVSSLVSGKAGGSTGGTDAQSILAMPVLANQQSSPDDDAKRQIKLPSGRFTGIKPAHPTFGRTDEVQSRSQEGNQRRQIPIKFAEASDFPDPARVVQTKPVDQLYTKGYDSNYDSPDFKVHEQFTVRQSNPPPPVPPKPKACEPKKPEYESKKCPDSKGSKIIASPSGAST